MPTVQTNRLTLRRWQPSDREPFARLNSDPAVMEFMPAPLTQQESDLLADRIEAHFHQHKFGLWAAELRSNSAFIGFIGLSIPRFQAPFTPCVEIGWRLASDYWGRGLVTEGACAVVYHAFHVLDLSSLVSFTSVANLRSRRVMEKIGMTHNPSEDFDHPNQPEHHPQRPHLLYRLSRSK
jgi:RimJ/RimL family protein N-acetyltransferase